MAHFFLTFCATIIFFVLKANFIVVIFLVSAYVACVFLLLQEKKAIWWMLCGIALAGVRLQLLPKKPCYWPGAVVWWYGVVSDVPDLRHHTLHFDLYLQSQQKSWHVLWRNAPAVQLGQKWHLHGRLLPYHRFKVFGGELLRSPAQPMTDLRRALSRAIVHAVPQRSLYAVLNALSIGARGFLQIKDWRVFRKTGTSHLIAISGLHVGLVAAMSDGLCVKTFKLLPRLIEYAPVQLWARVCSLWCALAYTLLSGANIPALRAWIMLLVFSLATIVGRPVAMSYRLLFAFFVMVAWMPYAVDSVSLWLSFYAVSLLCFIDSSRKGLRGWLSLQMVMTIGLVPVTMFFFHKVSLVAYLANLVAIPYTSFVLVPATVVAMLFSSMPVAVADFFWSCAAWLLKPLWWYLSVLAAIHGVQWQWSSLSIKNTLIVLVAFFLIISPRGLGVRRLGWMVAIYAVYLMALPLIF